MLLKPSHRLQKCGLLRVLDDSIVWICSNGKAMLNARIEVDLVWLANLLQDLLGTMPFFYWEDMIRLGSADSVWAFDGFELVLLNKGGMCTVSDIDLTRLQETDHIFGSKAISDSANFLEEH